MNGAPKPYFTGLPAELQKKIVGKTDVLERIRLRRVCVDFMFMCDNMDSHYKSVSIHYSDQMISTTIRSPKGYNSEEICYVKTEDGTQVAHGPGYKNRDENYTDIAVRDFIGILKNPKITIGTLEIDDGSRNYANRREFMLKIGREIFKFTHQLTVNHLIMNGDFTEDEILCIWPFVKPRTLENIDVWWGCAPPKTTDLLLESAQWRYAKRLNLRGTVPLEKLKHFRKCTMKGLLTVEDLELILDHILANLETFEEFQINLFLSQEHNPILDYIIRYPNAVEQPYESNPTKLITSMEDGVTIKLMYFKHEEDSFCRIWKDIPFVPMPRRA